MRTIHFTLGQQAAFVIGVVMMVLSLASGPYFASLTANQNRQQLIKLQQTQAGIQSLLDFVAKVQAAGGGGQAATEWYVNEMQAICAATAGCRQAPGAPQVTTPSTTTTLPHHKS